MRAFSALHDRRRFRSVRFALSNARGACLRAVSTHNADIIATSVLTTFMSERANARSGSAVATLSARISNIRLALGRICSEPFGVVQ